IKAFIPLRVTHEEEVQGLDIAEHGAYAYEMQETFKGLTKSNDSFAQRLTNLGKVPTPTNAQDSGSKTKTGFPNSLSSTKS
ncbi:MAG: ammonium transporter, partial [Solibacillus isronensis]